MDHVGSMPMPRSSRFHAILPVVIWCLFFAAACLCTTSPAAAAIPASLDNEVTVSAAAPRAEVARGEQFAIAVVLKFAQGWHAWPHKPVVPPELEGLDATPTTVMLKEGAKLPSGVALHLPWTQWPEPHETAVAGAKALTYSGRTVI